MAIKFVHACRNGMLAVRTIFYSTTNWTRTQMTWRSVTRSTAEVRVEKRSQWTKSITRVIPLGMKCPSRMRQTRSKRRVTSSTRLLGAPLTMLRYSSEPRWHLKLQTVAVKTPLITLCRNSSMLECIFMRLYHAKLGGNQNWSKKLRPYTSMGSTSASVEMK